LNELFDLSSKDKRTKFPSITWINPIGLKIIVAIKMYPTTLFTFAKNLMCSMTARFSSLHIIIPNSAPKQAKP
jgi:hypothetical protein